MTGLHVVDVLVVGLGPAGSRAAAEVARLGCTVLAVDRRKQAGDPVQCAEFVPAMISQSVAGLTSSCRQTIGSMVTYVETEDPDVKGDFNGHIIDRAAFDRELVRSARGLGADCRFAAPIARLTDGAAMLSDGQRVEARVMIGADGPRSLVGKSIGRVNTELVETRQITVPLHHAHEATDIYLSARIPGGYGWLFPKGRVANVGVGVMRQVRRDLKPLLDELHTDLVAKGRVGSTVLQRTGGAIPVSGLLDVVGRSGDTPVLLAGDAAGLTNPVTGAGINAAVISGALAGRAAAEHVVGRPDALADYREEVTETFGPGLRRALRRRRQLLDCLESPITVSPGALRRGWIAYPTYWAA